MPYINTTFTEGTFLTDLDTLLLANGWVFEKSFKKYAYPSALINPSSNIQPNSYYDISMARHRIYKNSQGVLYGFAQLHQESYRYSEIPVSPREDEAGFKTWLETELDKNYDRHEFFVYMLEVLPDIVEGGKFGCAVDVTPMRGAIDIEVISSRVVQVQNGYLFEYTEEKPEIMQSPFMEIVLRNPNLEGIDSETNWWPDSLVRVNGYIDSETIMLLMQADNTPAFENNVVPIIPLYMGKFESFKEGDIGNDALWGGTAFNTGNQDASHNFNFDSSTPYRETMNYLPVRKTYPNYPANGIDNIIVKRSELGARYQAYYLSWNTVGNQTPPDRVGIDGGQYPLAWNTEKNDEYKYQFNPSAYSGKVHTSRAYLVHPDEGVRGYLPKIILLSPFGLVNNDKLKVRKASCPDDWDIYRFFLTEAISPITKRPATVYRPAGIGIFEREIINSVTPTP